MIPQIEHGMRAEKDRSDLARGRFAKNLRGYVLNDLAPVMRRTYDERVAPALRANATVADISSDAVHDAMLKEPTFRYYSAFRYNAQEMCHRSVIPAIDRQKAALNKKAQELSARSDIGGSLTLDPDLSMPNYMAGIDVHLMPGSYVAGEDVGDVRAGAVYDNVTSIFAVGRMGKQMDDIGWSMAKFVRHTFADFAPKSILDSGCAIGHNTLPWAQEFTDATVHAVDVAAPGLRYAHARAQSLDVPVHFHQQNAETLQFEDNSFDLVFSSMFLHELPKEAIANYLQEAWRVLKPGGLLLTMELPPNRHMHAYDQFYLDWDSHYNNEPFYKAFRDMDPAALCQKAGFDADVYFNAAVPQYTFMPKDEFENLLRLNPDADTLAQAGRMAKGVNYRFAFGAWKS